MTNTLSATVSNVYFKNLNCQSLTSNATFTLYPSLTVSTSLSANTISFDYITVGNGDSAVIRVEGGVGGMFVYIVNGLIEHLG